MIDLAKSIPTLIGSLLSALAAGFVIFSYLIMPPQTHFRHTLILNLATADFVNALGNSISGVYSIRHGDLPMGGACTLSGFVGQLSVQGTDFSILAIAIATVITIRRTTYKPSMSKGRKVFITCAIWVVPLFTSFTALILGAFHPVSGNWCWLDTREPALLYGLGHGWRISIIFIVICLYTYLFIYIHKHFNSLHNIETVNRVCEPSRWAIYNINNSSTIQIIDDFEVCDDETHECTPPPAPSCVGISPPNCFEPAPTSTYAGSITRSVSIYSQPSIVAPPLSPCRDIKQTLYPSTSVHNTQVTITPLVTRDPLALVRVPRAIPIIQPTCYRFPRPSSPPPNTTHLKARERYVHMLLLLNAYPIAYVLLWVPGLMNRAAEASGHHVRWIQIAQSSTQYVGLANALVYGWNERIWGWAKLWWRGEGVWVKIDKKERVKRPVNKMDISWPKPY